MHISSGEVLLRLVIATLVASAIGLDRERHQRSAGLRTHALVGLASCLFTIVSAFGFSDALGSHVSLDPSRVAAQVASGIGFIGAGAIIMRRQAVRGLTTAASIWTVAALGMAVGCGLYMAATAATLIALLLLLAVKMLEKRLEKDRREQKIVATFDSGTVTLAGIIATLDSAGVQPTRISVQASENKGEQRVRIGVKKEDSQKIGKVLQDLATMPGIYDANATVQ
jgi:putative Mg2+ transporter-C (MgtC) family protein